MKLLYMDNFRGFKNTFLELKDVNFFVGDNSSGKTSVISLIGLLSSKNSLFYDSYSFNNKDFQLGSFDDIVDNKYKDFFIVGFLDTANSRFPIKLLKFIQGEKGKIQLSENIVVSNREKRVYTFKIKKGNLFFPPRAIFDEFNNVKELSSLFKKEIKKLNQKYRKKKNKEEKNYSIDFIRRSVSLYSSYNWVAPIRSTPKRIYEMIDYNQNNEDNTPYLLNTICLSNKNIEEKKEIEKFATKANLFKTLNSKRFFEKEQSPFSIEVSLDKNIERNIYFLGYGVSQSLPIVTQIIIRSKKYTNNLVHLIQQPEVHLHPKAQVAIGELIFHEAKQNKNVHFVVETHSDYIIDRFRLAQKKSKKKISSQVVFFQRQKTKNCLNTINIEDDGKYSTNQPKHFRDFFIKEAMRLLEI